MGELKECSFDPLRNNVSHWGILHHYATANQLSRMNMGSRMILSAFLSFSASSISSAGGLGGGGLYIPILNLVAGLDMKDSISISALMVTGSTLANVIYNLPLKHPRFSNKPLIDYDITLLSEPCLLLGVSVGVICNVMFPEWLITVMFACFLGCSTLATCKTGYRRWKQETEEGSWLDNRNVGEGRKLVVPLLNGERGPVLPWRKLAVLAAIWTSFFLLQILRGDLGGQSLIHLRPCGVGYWLIFGSQVPLAVLFTVYILVMEKTAVNYHSFGQDSTVGNTQDRTMLLFPLMAVASGSLSGLFGIAGGMIISPLLLQIGIPPHIAAATTSFMVSFSASMSAVQYLLMGLKHVDYALCFAAVCFISSWIGLVIIQKPIRRYGRASLIVFLVGSVMAISTVMITSFGALNVWREYRRGKYMGFKSPC